MTLTQRILDTVMDHIEEVGNNFVDIVDALSRYPHTFGHLRIQELHDRRDFARRRQVLRTIRDLKKKKLIETQKIGATLLLALTDTGRTRALRTRIHEAPLCKANECVIVIFDIPETQRQIRDLFRNFLYECGFTLLQKSVWTNTRAILPHVQVFIRLHDIGKWVHAFVARDVVHQKS
ncbi:hypothetical protein HY625_01430 [Candidatus Uhrbacteria bacterium]|nr:hypothetical protein [Candidatus Uhrbacteria bacterium]